MIALWFALTALAADWGKVDIELAAKQYDTVTPVVLESIGSDDADEQARAWARLGDLAQDHDLPYAALVAWSRSTPQALGAKRLGLAMDTADRLGESRLLEPSLTTLPNGLAEPTRTHAAVLGAQHHLRTGEYEEALILLGRLPTDSPAFVRGMNLKGVVLSQQRKYSDALAALLVADKASAGADVETRSQVLLNTGRAYYGAGNYLKAIEYFGSVPRGSLAWPEAQFERAWAHFMIDDYVGAYSQLETLRTAFFRDWYWAEADILRVWSLMLMCKYQTAETESQAYATRYARVSKDLAAATGATPTEAWDDLMRTFDGEATTLPASLLLPMRFQTRTREAREAVFQAGADLAALEGLPFAEPLKRLLAERRDAIREREGRRILQRITTARDESAELAESAKMLKLDILDAQTEMYTKASVTGELEYGDRIGRLRSLRKKRNTRVWPAQTEVWADEIGYYRVDTRSDCPEDQPK